MPAYPENFGQIASALVDVDRKLKYAFVPDQFRPHAIGDDSGRLLYTLAVACGALHLLEVGTSYGYSTLWMAAASKRTNGLVTTIERDAERSAAASALLESVRLRSRVHFLVGEAPELISQLDSPPDFVLIDADKEAYVEILQAVVDRVGSSPCVLVADNMISHRSRLVEFVTVLDRHERLTHVLLPVGKGLELCYLESDAGHLPESRDAH